MTRKPKRKWITIEVSDVVYGLLEVLTKGEYGPRTVEGVVETLVDHAQQGVYRPGAWERDWPMGSRRVVRKEQGKNSPKR